MILLLNGAFGIGKTTVARLVVRRLRRALLFDPELMGMALQRGARLVGRSVDDFQDLRAWRRLTILGLRVARMFFPDVVVPMAFSNPDYLEEIRRGITGRDARVVHVCLVAPLDVVHERLRRRGDHDAWSYRRAAECCIAHSREEFATHVNTAGRHPDDIAEDVLRVAGTIPPA